MSDRNILLPGASLHPFRSIQPTGVEDGATPIALRPLSVQFRGPGQAADNIRDALSLMQIQD
jgi:hypothetical protein